MMHRNKTVPLKGLAVPTEHGSWGILIEPLLLGLLVAPGLAGAAVAGLTSAIFLTRSPLRLVLLDWRRGRRSPRTRTAIRFSLIYGTAAGLFLALALHLSPSRFWVPLALAAPVGVFQLLVYDIYNRQRELAPQFLGVAVLSSSASAVVVAGGWSLPASSVLWVLLVARSVTAILFVRSQIRKTMGAPVRPGAMLTAHGLALVAAAGLASANLLPWPVAAAFLLLAGRAVHFHRRSPRPVQQVGWTEILFGLGAVLLMALGYRP